MIEPAEMGYSAHPCIWEKTLADSVLRTTEILKAAHHYGGAALKRFVLLGSAVSVLNSFEDMSREGNPYTEKDWNPVCI